MTRYDGSLKPNDQGGKPLQVTIDLNEDRLQLWSDRSVVAVWRLDDLLIRGEDDGFHVRLGGEEVVLSTNDDPGLAIELGLRSASPRLRRQMAARRR